MINTIIIENDTNRFCGDLRYQEKSYIYYRVISRLIQTMMVFLFGFRTLKKANRILAIKSKYIIYANLFGTFGLLLSAIMPFFNIENDSLESSSYLI